MVKVASLTGSIGCAQYQGTKRMGEGAIGKNQCESRQHFEPAVA